MCVDPCVLPPPAPPLIQPLSLPRPSILWGSRIYLEESCKVVLELDRMFEELGVRKKYRLLGEPTEKISPVLKEGLT